MSLFLRLLPDSTLARKYVSAAKEFTFVAETAGNPVLSVMEGVDDVPFHKLKNLWKRYNSIEKEFSRRGYKTISPQEIKDYCNKCVNDVPLSKRDSLEKVVLYSVSVLKSPKVEATLARYQPHSLHIRQDEAVSSPGSRH